MRSAGLLYSIVHATQFFEFVEGFADAFIRKGLLSAHPPAVTAHRQR